MSESGGPRPRPAGGASATRSALDADGRDVEEGDGDPRRARRRRPRAVHRPPRPDDRRRPAPRLQGRRPRQPPRPACAWSSTPPATASAASRRCSARPTRPRRTRVQRGRPVALDAMSATERKVVHEYLKERDGRRDVLRGRRARPPPRRRPARRRRDASVSRETPGRRRAGRTRSRPLAAHRSSCRPSTRRRRPPCATGAGASTPRRRLARGAGPAVRRAAPTRIADLGSGAGWPGLALAAALPARGCALVESAIRQCRYLERGRRGCGLDERRGGPRARRGVGRRAGRTTS